MKSRVYGILFFIMFFLIANCNPAHKGNNILSHNKSSVMEGDTLINRKPAVAGSFYPATKEDLTKEVEKLFSSAAPNQGLQNIVALFSPHAGYVFSGQVAASAFNQLSKNQKYENVFIIGSSHRTAFDGAAIYSEGNFITPLGIANVNIPLAKKLIEEHPDVFKIYRDAHWFEHSLEVQIPFLQYIYKDDLRIVPILLGTQRQSTCKLIADALKPYFNERNLFVISSDFSHYPNYKDACIVDEATAKAIVTNSPANFLKALEINDSRGISNLATSACGWTSILSLMDITENMQGLKFHRIKYMNSGDTPYGEKDRVVGYHAIVVTLENKSKDKILAENQAIPYNLNEEEKKTLLSIARNTIKQYLATGRTPSIDAKGFSEKLLQPSGAFVTLNKNRELRGCIGRFTSEEPLYKVIQEMSISSATRDYRFPRLESDELSKVDIEISVLTPMHKIESIKEIILGKHGVYIKKGAYSGTFLPQVAQQTGWSIEEFLGHCARDKAGIGWDGWKDAEIYIYEAFVFSEKEKSH